MPRMASSCSSIIEDYRESYPLLGWIAAPALSKYVVLYGAKYSSYNLVDMRILDINVVADLTRHDPMAPDPAENDGTLGGSGSASQKSSVDTCLSNSAASISSYWTGWWPVLHIIINWPVSPSSGVILHITIDLLLNIRVLPDGLFSVFTPVLEHHGYTGTPAIQKTEESVYRAKCFMVAVGDPWDAVDNLAVAVAVAGLVAGIHPIGTAIWLLLLAAWILAIINAIAFTYNQVATKEVSLLEGSLYIMQKGLQYLFLGSVDLIGGAMLNMAYVESAAYLEAVAAAGRVAWSAVDDLVVGFVVSGVIQMIVGFGIVVYGFMLGMGLF